MHSSREILASKYGNCIKETHTKVQLHTMPKKILCAKEIESIDQQIPDFKDINAS